MNINIIYGVLTSVGMVLIISLWMYAFSRSNYKSVKVMKKRVAVNELLIEDTEANFIEIGLCEDKYEDIKDVLDDILEKLERVECKIDNIYNNGRS